jgi:hypothetical protein
MAELIAGRSARDDDCCSRPSGGNVIRRSAPSPTLVATTRREVPAGARALMLAALVCVFIPLFVFADESHWLPRLVEGGHLSLIPGPARQSSQTHPARARPAGNGRRDDAASRAGAVVGRRARGRRSSGVSSFVIHSARRDSPSSQVVVPGAHGSAAGEHAPVADSTHLDQPASGVPQSTPARAAIPTTNASADPGAHTGVTAGVSVGAAPAIVAPSVQATAANADATAVTLTTPAVSTDATVAGQTAAVGLPSGSSPAAPIGGSP